MEHRSELDGVHGGTVALHSGAELATAEITANYLAQKLPGLETKLNDPSIDENGDRKT